jgi:hypothetical protein
VDLGAAHLLGRTHAGQVLRPQAGLGSGPADVVQLEGLAGGQGQRQAAAQELAAAVAAVEQEGFGQGGLGHGTPRAMMPRA